MDDQDGRVLGWLTRFHDSGPVARMVSALLLAVTSISIVLGALATAQLTRPAGPVPLAPSGRAVAVAGPPGMGGG